MADETTQRPTAAAASASFNPRPPVMADETARPPSQPVASNKFQSASASNGGRNFQEAPLADDDLAVSIRVRQ